MDLLEDLLGRMKAYATRTGTSEATLSRKLLGNSLRADQIRSGSDINWSTLKSAREKMAELEKAELKEAGKV